MNFFLTFVASDLPNPLQEGKIAAACESIGVPVGALSWLAAGKAADVPVAGALDFGAMIRLREFLAADKIDVFYTPAANRRKKLLLADMDSTIVTGETLDDLAGFAGLKEQVAGITARAMNGELDFHAALYERVGLLKGLSTDFLQKTLDHMVLSAGAERFLRTIKHHGGTCVLVSGGFTFFTGAIAAQVGFDHHHGNVLGIEGDALTGLVLPPILDKFAKVEFLEHYVKIMGLTLEDAITIGDGANDIPMLKAAGLGVGYHPKPAVAAEIGNCIVHGDLTAALYAQGYSASEIA